VEIKQYLIMLRRWAWLLIVGLIVGVISGYVYSIYQTPVYQSETKMLVMRAPQSQNNSLDYLATQQLGQTFIQLLKTKPVLDLASQKLSFTVKSSQITATQLNDTQVINLKVEDASPERSAAIANTLVDVLIEQNDNLQSGRYATNEESLNAQVKQIQEQTSTIQGQIDQITTQNVQEQITKVEAKISELQSEIATLDNEMYYLSNRGKNPEKVPPESTAKMAQLKSTLELYQGIYSNLIVLGKPSEANTSDRLAHLQKTLELYQQIYLQLLGSLEQVRLARLQNTPTIIQIEEATVPSSPIRPLPLQNTLMAGAVGLMLAFGIAFAVEYLDETLRSPLDVDQILGLPVLGYIAEMKQPKEGNRLYVASYPRSPVGESFRTLRSNIEFTDAERPPKTILVTSSRPGEGKTTIASNLAAIYAQSGKRVVLVDADLRRPSIHTAVGLPNRLGLTTLFRDSLKPENVWKNWQDNGVRGMHIITSGRLPSNPAELLGSDKMLQIMSELRKIADVIIFDGPPIMVADVQILASLMDGVILVLRPGKSPADEAKSTLVQLKRSGANVMGVIFNRIPKNGSQHYGAYRYYSPNAYGYNNNQKDKTEPIVIRPVEITSFQPAHLSGFQSTQADFVNNKKRLN
jgi:capsular exopolysaccharide synthesis family protein